MRKEQRDQLEREDLTASKRMLTVAIDHWGCLSVSCSELQLS